MFLKTEWLFRKNKNSNLEILQEKTAKRWQGNTKIPCFVMNVPARGIAHQSIQTGFRT